ncbi:MAG: CDP-glycerol glycerophosphotransferase family protein [Patescibacteria group bacterium]
METLFISISRGGITRNFFQTGIIQELLAKGLRLVIFTPAYAQPEFVSEFAAENLWFEPLYDPPRNKTNQFFNSLMGLLIYNATTDMIANFGVFDASETSPFKLYMYRAIFKPLSKLPFLRSLARLVDRAVCREKKYGPVFEKYKPSAVFVTNVVEDPDCYLLKAAQARGIPMLGMAKSWDNLAKKSLRVKPDQLLIWSKYQYDEAVKFDDYRADQLVITGIPQFDIYRHHHGVPERADFFASLGLDPAKRLVTFTSEAKLSQADPDYVDMLWRAIQDGRIPNAQLLVRPHFGFRNDLERFLQFKDRPNLALDQDYKAGEFFYDQTDYSFRHWSRLAATLLYADVVVTTFSTITLDATAAGKPVINVAFDGYAGLKPKKESMVRYFDFEHYRPVCETGAPLMAGSEEELISAVNRCLADKDINSEGRQRLLQGFIEPLDGKSVERTAQAVVAFVRKNG